MALLVLFLRLPAASCPLVTSLSEGHVALALPGVLSLPCLRHWPQDQAQYQGQSGVEVHYKSPTDASALQYLGSQHVCVSALEIRGHILEVLGRRTRGRRDLPAERHRDPLGCRHGAFSRADIGL